LDLGRKVRAEPGCLIFIPYESQIFPGRFYIYEVYQDAAAFGVHMQSEHVKHFMSELPALSTNSLDAVVELDEIPIPHGPHTQRAV
jgi:quinol monooxygenase YgiN